MEKSRSLSRESSVTEDLHNVTGKKPLTYLSLYRYSTGGEKCVIMFGIFLAILSGCIPPVVNVLYGEFCNLMVERQFPTDAPSTKTFILSWFGGGKILQNASASERREALSQDSKAWGIGCAVFTFLQFLFSMLSVFLLNFTASRQISRIKILFFQSVLCKDMAWFDTHITSNFAGQTSQNLFLTEKGIAEVLAIFTFQFTVGIVNIIISFLHGWRLSLVLMMFVIPVSISAFFAAKVQSNLSANEMESSAKAGSVAEEVFSSIRTVVAFEGENKEVERYSRHVEKTQAYGIKRGIVSGISNGLSWFIIYCSYAVAFVYGVRLIRDSSEHNEKEYTPGVLLIVFFGIVTALTNLGFAFTHLETFSVACGAAAVVFDVIRTKSKINPCEEDGDEPDEEEFECKGEIEFRNVYFEYPARASVRILRGLNLKIKAGELVAIVGGSGAGKSTILQLIQRLYDPSKGNVFLDDRNIKSFNVSWLRKQLGVVGQEPLLFSTTIRANILYGNMSATNEDVREAAMKANAHQFIIKLKDGYDTIIGQKGSTLSGGQKQRIAIARALIRDPKILLLDEATSALDASSEKLVQEALKSAAKGRTTVIVTHKLSSIVNADRIVVLQDGVVAEEGTHNQLIKTDGQYKELLKTKKKNVRENTELSEEIPTRRITNKDLISLPPTSPQSRFSSVGSLMKHPKSQRSQSFSQIERTKYLEIIKWGKPEWLFIVGGVLVSIIGGSALPIVCVMFGHLFGLLSLTDFTYIINETDRYAVLLVAVGVAAGICVFLQMYCFAVSGMKLASRLRVKAFNCMIRQEIGYFDDEKNKVGALCYRLSHDPLEIQNAMSIRLGILMQAFSTMTIGIAISLFLAWKIAVVAAATIPFVFTGVYLESVFVHQIFDRISEESASKLAVEVISNIKAVAALGIESLFIEQYSTAIKGVKKTNFKKACFRGFSFAIGQTAPFFGYAITLWCGGHLVAEENLHYKYVIMVSELLIFGAWSLGQSLIVVPNLAETKFAAGRLKYIFLRHSRVFEGEILTPPNMNEKGFIQYSKVNFTYPASTRHPVLQDFSMLVKSGKSVGVMGPSGSGKSTVIQLLLRFYSPSSGRISINGENIAQYKLSTLRKIFGFVSQEPVLFDKTIHENIAYGDNTRMVPLSEVIEAAESANIHSFIAALPLGYDTYLGNAGAHLSGGQKQRVAIARALVRNPQILLLDEATSALDPQSESVVQEALDKASEGRTTITIAHRFSAVRNADVIYVLSTGRVEEFGNHETLMSLKGLYFSMYAGDIDGDIEEDTINEANTSEN